MALTRSDTSVGGQEASVPPPGNACVAGRQLHLGRHLRRTARVRVRLCLQQPPAVLCTHEQRRIEIELIMQHSRAINTPTTMTRGIKEYPGNIIT